MKVMEVDVERQRIGLSLRLDDEPGQPAKKPQRGGGGGGQRKPRQPRQEQRPAGGSMADALKRAGMGR